jgi:hypothetical protein
MGSLCAKNAIEKFSRLGTFKSNLEKDFAETVYLSEAPSTRSSWGGQEI